MWDRLKEVPNRYPVRSPQVSLTQGGLRFEDFVEIAALSDQQLALKVVGRVIEHCWGIEEWGMIRGGSARREKLPALVPYSVGNNSVNAEASPDRSRSEEYCGCSLRRTIPILSGREKN